VELFMPSVYQAQFRAETVVNLRLAGRAQKAVDLMTPQKQRVEGNLPGGEH
jgi:hypothetical protein